MWSAYWHDLTALVLQFIDRGGLVLLGIILASFVMWFVMCSRWWYLRFDYPLQLQQATSVWHNEPDQHSWFGRAKREQLISELQLDITQNIGLIKVFIALCPMLGLLGTVTGMIDVFAVLAMTGGGDIKAMAAGVSRATIPTMAGMVAGLSGVFGLIYFQRQTSRLVDLLPEHFTLEVPRA